VQQKQDRRIGRPGFAIEELETVDFDGVNGSVLGGGSGGCGHDGLLVGGGNGSGGDGFFCGALAFLRNLNNLLFTVTRLRWNSLSV
jgi:hypothetical protein